MIKRYIAFITIACGLGLLACNDEGLTGSGQGNLDGIPAVEAGRYVVDYSLESGEFSRVDGDMDNETTVQQSPVRSLTYLLYEYSGTDESDNKVYTLVKRREIRDISENTQWPLIRENMTWNQREDLKDTLDRSSEYKVVFVANAAASLHNGEEVLIHASLDMETPEEGEEPQEPLLDFTDAYLKMPLEPFTDDNLFYVVSHDFSVENLTENTDYVSLPLTLKRVVARTELTCAAVPQETELKERLQNSLYGKLVGTGTDDEEEWTVWNQVKNNLNPLFAEDVYGKYETYTITVSNGDGTETTEPCGEKLRELLGGRTLLEAVVKALEGPISLQLYKGLVIDPLMLDYQNPFPLQYNWKAAHAVKVTFESRTDKVGLDGKFAVSGTETAPVSMSVPVQEDGTVNLTTFCTAEAVSEEGETLDNVQVIKSLAFYSEQVAETESMPVFTITCQEQYPLKLDLAANQKISLELDPAVQIFPKEGWYPTDDNLDDMDKKYVEVSVTVDLERILDLEVIFADMQPPTSTGDTSTEEDNPIQEGGTGTNYYKDFNTQINSVIEKEGLGTLNGFKITVKIPNTFNPETYTCVPGWRQVENTPSNNE